MSNPSFDNIDKWLFEYTEGNLSPYQEAQLKQFLLQNPEFEQDLDAWEDAFVDGSPVVYPYVSSHIRKPLAWWVPASAITTLVVSGVFSWLSINSLTNSSLIPDSAYKSISANIQNPSLNDVSEFASIQQENNFSNVNNPRVIQIPVYGSNSVVGQYAAVGSTQKDELYDKYEFEKSSVNFEQSSAELIDFTELKIEENDGSKKPIVSENDLVQNSDNSSVGKSEEKNRNARIMSRTENKFAATYNKSFSAKLKSLTRKIVRMTDNPIALSNSKDIYYHTPGMQSLDVNFGSVGSLLTPRLQTITRAQWTGHNNQQFSNQLSYDTYVKSVRGGIGVQLNHVYYGGGQYQIGQFALMYSPKFAISKNVVIEPAIRFKMGNSRLNNQKMTPGQMVEINRQNARQYNGENIESKTQELWYKDVGFALMSNTKWFSAGVQIDNIGRHYSNVYNSKDQNDRQGYHLTATVGTDYVSRSKLFSFSPYVMYQKVENLSEIWGGSIFRYKKLTMGGGISSLGDYAGSIGIKTNRFMLTYAIDHTQSAILNTRLLSQQLTLRLLTNRNRKDYRMLNL